MTLVRIALLAARGIDVTGITHVINFDLPDSFGLDTLDKFGAAARLPIIVLTGNPHPALVPEALKRHAYEVVRKSELEARSLMRIVRLASLRA